MSRRYRSPGFTLVELIAVLIIVAVIAITASSGLDRQTHLDRAAADTVQSTLTWVRNTAMSTRRMARVQVFPDQLVLDTCSASPYDTACTYYCAWGGVLGCPSAYTGLVMLQGTNVVTWAGGATINAAIKVYPLVLYFDSQGRLTDERGLTNLSTTTLLVSGPALTSTLQITPATGYVSRL